MKHSIEPTLYIYESRKWLWFLIVFELAVIAVFTWVFMSGRDHSFGWVLLVVAPILGYSIYKKIKKLQKPPQKKLVIAIDGIGIYPNTFVSWDRVRYAGTKVRHQGRYAKIVVEVQTVNGQRYVLPTMGLTKNSWQLQKLIENYQDYYKKHVRPIYHTVGKTMEQ